MSENIQTCSASLLYPGDCCGRNVDGTPCPHPATLAAVAHSSFGIVEHTRCAIHVSDCLATKPLIWDEIWGPTNETKEQA